MGQEYNRLKDIKENELYFLTDRQLALDVGVTPETFSVWKNSDDPKKRYRHRVIRLGSMLEYDTLTFEEVINVLDDDVRYTPENLRKNTKWAKNKKELVRLTDEIKELKEEISQLKGNNNE